MLSTIIKFFAHFIFALLSLWGILALFYSVVLPSPVSIALAIVFALASIFCHRFFSRKRKLSALIVWVVLFAAIVAHWLMIKPSHNLMWRADMARMPYAEIEGDTITLFNYRDFKYRDRDDFIPRYEHRTVQLSHLTSVDYFISYWWQGPVAHTFLSFNFDNAPPVCVSIEARYEEHEGFDPIASMFKQFELIYIVGSEQDIVGVRTNYRNEEVFLYPVEILPATAQQLFMVYINRINQLAAKPEFYNLLSSNCTLNIVRYANKIGRQGGWDIRLILNGYTDRYLYDNGYIDTSLPFSETRARAYINPHTPTLIADDFSQRIRGQ